MIINLKKENKKDGERSIRRSTRKKTFTLLTLLLLSVILLSVPMISVHAETVCRQSPKVTLSAVVRTTGEVPEIPEVYTIRMTAIDRAPLQDSSEDFLDLTLTGPGTVTLPEIVYPTVGIYRYTVFQIAGNVPDAEYDDGVYQVAVTVTDPESEDGLTETVAILKDGVKQDSMEFVDHYNSKPLAGGGSPPPYVPDEPPADIIPDDPPVDVIPDDPPVDGTPDTPPVEKPSGGSESHSNGTLIQTGQRKLPVLFLGFAGTVLTASGGLLLCKNKRERKERDDK